jgi:GNAT superfamily N-acetyltransferase
MKDKITIQFATMSDVPLILEFIKELAEYEKLRHEVVATEELLRKNLFGSKPCAEVIIVYFNENPAGFALFFHNFSTFLGKPGIYLEDLYIRPEYRGQGLGQMALVHLAKLTKDRDCGRLEWWVLNWNEDAINFYKRIGAKAMDEWTVYRMTDSALEDLTD